MRYILAALLLATQAAFAQQQTYRPTASVLLDQALQCEQVADAALRQLTKERDDLKASLVAMTKERDDAKAPK